MQFSHLNGARDRNRTGTVFLPRDFKVSIENQSMKWVINAQPRLTTEEWLEMHGLDNSEPLKIEN